jgi:hypothetical protein
MNCDYKNTTGCASWRRSEMFDLWENMDCERCQYYRLIRGKISMDPIKSYPAREVCLDGDFGNRWLCGQAKEALKEHEQEA